MNFETKVINEYERLILVYESKMSLEDLETLKPTFKQQAFLTCKMEELQGTTETTEEYKNGENQQGTKISSKLKAYNECCKSYQENMKIIANVIKNTRITESEKVLSGFIWHNLYNRVKLKIRKNLNKEDARAEILKKAQTLKFQDLNFLTLNNVALIVYAMEYYQDKKTRQEQGIKDDDETEMSYLIKSGYTKDGQKTIEKQIDEEIEQALKTWKYD